jgi:peptidoglycan/LPS O-acetylase OafA/YrhL
MKDGHQDLSASHSGKKLDALTSLRFIAVAMIVVFHCQGQFGLKSNIAESFTLNQAVSFFFVLSGFILVYVYPALNGIRDSGRFLLARIARLWPAHAATLILASFLIPLQPSFQDSFPWIFLANLSMVHAWVPLWDYFFSFNSVSWAVSTELFFYLAFPLLIYRWHRTWPIKLLASFALLGVMIYLADIFHLPKTGPVSGVSLPALVYISPLARLCEFVFGMTVAWAWRRKNHCIPFGRITGTLVELIVLAATVASIHYTTLLSFMPAVRIIDGGEAVSYWISSSGSAPLFGLLIFVMALERGLVSRLLSWRVAVLLGEISYSVYLVHQLLLSFFLIYPHAFSGLPGWVAYTAYWMMVLVVSHLLWTLIEKPFRRLIRGLVTNQEQPPAPPLSNASGRSAAKGLLELFRRFDIKPRRLVIIEIIIFLSFFLSLPVIHRIHSPFFSTQRPLSQDAPTKVKPGEIVMSSSFSASLPDALSGLSLESGGYCNAEMINNVMISNEATVVRKEGLTLVGWAVDDRSAVVPATVIVQLSAMVGERQFYASAGRVTKRPDVAKAFNNPAFENAGYDLASDISVLPVGRYAIRIIQVVQKKAIVCDTKKILSIE